MKTLSLVLAGLLLPASALVAVAPAQAAVSAGPRPVPRAGSDQVRPTTPQRVQTKGVAKVFVIRAEWTGADATTRADIDAAFAKAGAWLNEVSLGQFRIVTTSGPNWVHIPTSDCTQRGVDTLMNRAIAAQRADTPSFNPAAYQRIVAYFPNQAACNDYAGLGETPGKYVWLNGVFPDGYSTLDDRTIDHELGHTLGLEHASTFPCTSGGTAVTISRTCGPYDEYGDDSDDMGGANSPQLADGSYEAPAYSASQQFKLGWLGSRLHSANPCEDVTLSPYEGSHGNVATAFAGTQGVTYWLEWRHPAAGTVDAGLPSGLKDGPLLHITIPHTAHPLLLDGRPSTATFDDAAIPAGTVITTPEGFVIKPEAASGSSLTIHIRTTLPTAPARVATRGIPGGALVAWKPPACTGASAITGYRLQVRGTGSTRWRSAGTAAGTRHSFRVGGLLRSHRYVVRVTAVNAQGLGIAGTTSALVRPLAPHALLRVGPSRRLLAGSALRQSVVLRDPVTHRPLRGVRVTLQARAGRHPWHTVARPRTTRNGIAGTRTRPLVSTRYRWVYPGDRGHSYSISRILRVAVSPVVGASTTRRTVARGGTVTIYGRTLPARPGVRLALQIHKGHRWVTVRVGRTTRRRLPGLHHRAIGYVFALRAGARGRFVLRVVARATSTNAVGISHPIRVRVR